MECFLTPKAKDILGALVAMVVSASGLSVQRLDVGGKIATARRSPA